MRNIRVSLLVVWVLGQMNALAEPPKLREADWKHRDDLQGTTSVAVSPDGKHLYATAFKSGTIVAFQRDAKTGKMAHFQTLETPESQAWGSAVSIRLSPDGERAVVASFGTDTVSLLKREPETGKLSPIDSIGEMDFVIEAALSPDGKNIYAGCSSSLRVLSVAADGVLEQIEEHSGKGTPLRGIRCVKTSSDGKNVYAASTHTGELLTYQRDPLTGKLRRKQRLGNGGGGNGGPKALNGIHFLALSPDGKHLYTVTGRFGGLSAVAVFARGEDGELAFIQELLANTDAGPDDFEGGNEIAVSPDGKLVYAVASLSDTLARFSRDAETGKLEFIESIPVGEKTNPGSAGIAFSADGKTCYVADEDAAAIWGFVHKAAD